MKRVGHKAYLVEVSEEIKRSGSRAFDIISIEEVSKITKVNRGSVFALYRQHKNGFFYLKRIGKCVDIQSHVFFDANHKFRIGQIKRDKNVTYSGRKTAVVLFGYKYADKLLSMLPESLNIFNLNKGKNDKKKHEIHFENIKLF